MDAARLSPLDGLRGLASLVVVIHHVLLAGSVAMCAAFLGQTSGTATELLASSPLRLVWAGHEAVRVFFVLSGFVLVLPYAQGRSFKAGAYYPSRLLRLYLPAIGALVLAAALHAAIGWSAEGTWWLSPHAFALSWTGFAREASLLGDYAEGNFPLFTAIWTLKWEVLFSLSLPACIWAVSRFRIARLVILVACIGLIAWLDPNKPLSYVPLFPLGAAAAYELNALRALAARAGRLWGLALLLSAVLVTVPSWWQFHPHLTLGLQAGAALGLVATAATGAGSGLLTSPPIRWLGKRSFSLYLVHEPLVVSAAFILGATAELAIFLPVALLVALLGAELFYRGVEHPAHQLARRVAKRGVVRVPEAAEVTAPKQRTGELAAGTPSAR